MGRGKKTPSKKIADIVTAKLTNPDLSTRDIEAQSNIPHNTVSRILNTELEQVGTNKHGQELIAINVSIMNKGKKLIDTYLQALEIKSYSDLTHISGITETAFKQNQLLGGNATERIEHEIVSDQQKRIIASRYKDE